MALAPGSRVGPYEITAHLDAGGMGEAYLATDARLKRNVAIKILPEAFASDAQRLARFEREAQVLAALNHPNIAHVYGLEHMGPSTSSGQGAAPALVMELVEGPTLADRLSEGPLPVAEALSIAKQIAEALEVAHEQGIIHRDLKPSNIKGPLDGTVKVLDFGLAKVLERGAVATTASAVITSPAMTQMGMILGTAAYMSPEQAKGREADRRSDVWAFGAIVYEMLTGQRAFDGEDISETMAAVLKSDPDWTLLPADVPQVVRTLIQRCLEKDRRQRVAEISTAKFILSELPSLGAPQVATPIAARRTRWRWLLPAAVATVLAGIILGVTAWALQPRPTPPAIAQFAIAPAGHAFSGLTGRALTLSPDGKLLAYTANRRIYVRSLDELEVNAIPGLEADFPVNPAFSPDGQSLTFFSVTEGLSALKRIPITGGVATTLATFDEGLVFLAGLSWSPLGILVGGQRNGVLRVPLNGGTPERLIAVGDDELASAPQLLPDGRTVLFTVAQTTEESRWDKAQVVVQPVSNGTRRVLIEGADGRYLPSGHLLFAAGGTMYVAPFDLAKLAITGPAVAVIHGVRRATGAWSGLSQLTFSDTGTLAYIPGPATPNSSMRALVLGDGRNDPVPLKVTPATYVHPRVSPSGLVLAVGRNDGQSSDIWTYELSGKSEIRRLTFEGNNRFPVWAGDRRVAFQSTREGDKAIWWQSVSGGTAERLTRPAPDEEHLPEAWSRDGTRMLFSIVKASQGTKVSPQTHALWVYTLEGKRLEPVGKVTSSEALSATFSPDGRWIAYARTERAGGALSPNRGVFVEPFPPTGERHQVPKRLIDFHPVWSPDGKSIFYIPGSAQPAVSVPVSIQPSVTFGTPTDPPRNPMPGLLSIDSRGYDLLPDGRFISVAPSSGESPTGVPQVELRVFLNWFEDLKRRAPSQ